MRSILALALCLVSAVALAAEPTITLPPTIKGSVGSFVVVPATTEGATVKWHAITPGLNLFPVELLRDTKRIVVTASRDGEYRLLAYTAVGDVPSDPAETVIVIGTPAPVPPGPGPGPAPVPVPPSPTPTPGPVSETGPIKFLVVYETELRDDNGADISWCLPIVYSTKVREYLKSHCQKGANGNPEFRFWDDDYTDDQISAEAEHWKRVYKMPRDSEPWYVISNEKYADKGPLPKTEDEVLKLLKKYGGQ